jgi:hypothetical protein
VASEPVFLTAPLHLKAQLSYTDKNGAQKVFNLDNFVSQAHSIDSHTAHLTISHGQTGTPKPLAAASALWGLEPDFPASVIKIATILDK